MQNPIPISKATQQLADRIQTASPKPLTKRQAIRRAMWLWEQARSIDEQLADWHEGQQPNQ